MECKIKIEKGKHLELFTLMNRIRLFEQIAEELFLHGEVPGFLHSSIGQEASAQPLASTTTWRQPIGDTAMWWQRVAMSTA